MAIASYKQLTVLIIIDGVDAGSIVDGVDAVRSNIVNRKEKKRLFLFPLY